MDQLSRLSQICRKNVVRRNISGLFLRFHLLNTERAGKQAERRQREKQTPRRAETTVPTSMQGSIPG